MSEHPNATAIRSMFEAMGKGDMQSMANVLDDNVIWHEIGNPEPVRGKAALAARFSGSSSDFTITGETHDVVGGDDHTVALLSATATRGGKSFSYRVAEIYHFRDGKIVERWAFSDDTAAIAAFFA
jgi:ketosteroid isomerase-like protein